MNRSNNFHGFQFNDHFILNYQIRLEPQIKFYIFPNYRQNRLSLYMQTIFIYQLIVKNRFVYRLEQSGSQLAVNALSSINNNLCNFILFHKLFCFKYTYWLRLGVFAWN